MINNNLIKIILIIICVILFNILLILLLKMINLKPENFSNISNNIDIIPDKIYVINLDKNKDRWDTILKTSKKANINISRFPAIYGKTLSKDDKKIKKYFKKNNTLTNGQIGCALSHIEIWNDAIKNNYKTILIFEDDAEIPENFWDKYNKVIKELPFKWDMLLLGGVKLGGRKYSKNLLIPDNRSGNWGTHAMLINVKFLKKIIDNIKNIDIPIDDYLINNYYYNTDYNIFLVSKTIVPVNYEFNSDINVGIVNKNYDIVIYKN
jgi:glycosyl transferase family 25